MTCEERSYVSFPKKSLYSNCVFVLLCCGSYSMSPYCFLSEKSDDVRSHSLHHVLMVDVVGHNH